MLNETFSVIFKHRAVQRKCNKKENAQFSLLLSCRSTAMVCLSGSPSSCSFCYSVLGPFSFVRRKQRCLEFTCSELVSALSSLSSFSPFGSFTVSESLTKLDEEFSIKIWYSTPIPCWIPCYLYTTSLLSLWKSSIYHLSKYTISSILKIVQVSKVRSAFRGIFATYFTTTFPFKYSLTFQFGGKSLNLQKLPHLVGILLHILQQLFLFKSRKDGSRFARASLEKM